MKKKNSFLRISTIIMLYLLIAPLALWANEGEKGTLRGRVLSKDSIPIPGVYISLKQTNYRGVTSENGTFEFKVPAGPYTLVVSMIGKRPFEQPVEITEARTTQLPDILLDEKAVFLSDVVVVGNKYKLGSKVSNYVAKMPLANLENPQVYFVAGKALLQEQAITDYTSAVRAIPGVSGVAIRPGFNSFVFLRGFETKDNFRDGLYIDQSVNVDPINTESMEVIKGPSGTLFGSAGVAYGGLINRVTKKPFESTAGEIGINLGSYRYNRVTVDVNTPLNEEKTMLFRLTGAGVWDYSFQDYGYRKSYTIAPTFSYKASDKLSFLLSTEFFHLKPTSPSRVDDITVPGLTKLEDLQRDYFKSYGSNGLNGWYNTRTIISRTGYRFSERWKLEANVSYSDYGYEIGNIFLGFVSDTLLKRYYGSYSGSTKSFDFQPVLNGDFYIGKMRNRLVAGLDYMNRDVSYAPLGNAVFIDEFNYTKRFVPAINTAKVLADGQAASVTTRSRPITYAAYISDVLSITSRLNVLLSLRYDYFDNARGTETLETGVVAGDYTQGNVSPKVGATYQVVPNKVSLFANYQNGFNNQFGQDIRGIAFKPERAWQYEGGVKTELMHGNLSSTVSYYNIRVDNALMQDPDNPGFNIQDGTQRSQGIEAELTGTLFPGFNIVSGYTYNKKEFIKANAAVKGKRPAGPPEHAANIWLSYSMPKGRFEGLGAGLGGNYSGRAFFNDANTVSIPAYALLNAVLFYNTQAYRISLKADNLTDKKYWDAYGMPQLPRRFILAVAYKFQGRQ